MQDTHLHQQILGLSEPWFVRQIDLDTTTQRVTVVVEHRDDATWRCPHCVRPAPLYDHSPPRHWRHLDTCQFQTHVQARPPRVSCPEHDVCTVKLPWAEPGCRFTLLMERFVIDVLQACQNIQAACRLINISWDQASHVMRRAVERGLRRRTKEPVRYLGVDEKRFRRGHVHATVVTDLEEAAVQEVTEHHTRESVAYYYRHLSQEQLEGIEAIAMDMHQTYIIATAEHVPDGMNKIVFDRFHVMRQANEALERVRTMEHRQLHGQGENILTGAKQMLLWSDEKRPDKYAARFEELRRRDLQAGRAWAMKEMLRQLWDQPLVRHARAFFNHWRGRVEREAIGPMVRLVKWLTPRIESVIRFCEHSLTTATCEGINSRIAAIQHRAAGYRNFHRLRQAIFFFCGKLNLYP